MGMAHFGEHLYLAGEYEYICGRVEYTFSDSVEIYLEFNGVSGDIFDIAYDSGDIWLARDHPDQPLQKFDITGTVVDFVSSTVILRAHGLTMDDEGFLWVSDMETDLIHCISLETSISPSTWAGIKLLR